MPTTKQLQERWYNDFMFGKDVYEDTPNIRGSAYVGKTRGWDSIQAEDEERRNKAYSIGKKLKSDIYRFS